MKLKSGHEVIELSDTEQEEQGRIFKAYESLKLIRLHPNGWIFFNTFQNYADQIYNFECKSTDVFIMTYPKCGTTWMQEIIWTMRNNPDLNNPLAEMPLKFRSPFIEFDFLLNIPYMKSYYDIMATKIQNIFPNIDQDGPKFLQLAQSIPEPRTIKSHLPLSLMPKQLLDKCKVVYVTRNPKDVCVSFYHHSRLLKLHDYIGTLQQFVDYFIEDKLIFGPFWTHLEEALKMKDHLNMHLVFYEDMKANPKMEIKRLNDFLQTNLNDKQIDKVVEYTSFSSMKAMDSITVEQGGDHDIYYANKDVKEKDGGFFRKGQSGDWKNELTKEQENKITQWSKKHIAGTILEVKWKNH